MTAALVGAAAGVATGLVPGLHVNTVAVLVAATLPFTEATILALVAVGTVHTFVGILPATYLGAPDEDTAMAALPAHQLLLDGMGPTAIRISALASLRALVWAIVLVLPYKWLLLEPLRGLQALEVATPWIIAGVIGTLLAMQWRRLPTAAVTFAAAGVLGLVVLPATLPGGASPLLPLLAGLFGAPTLLWSLHHATAVPRQQPPRPIPSSGGDLARGVGASLWTAVLPGLTSAVATAIASAGRRRPPESIIATLSAVNTAHAVLAMPVLWLTLHARTGLAHAVAALPLEPWIRGAPPRLLVLVMLVALAAGLAGTLATLGLDRLIRPWVHRVPARALSATGLAVIVVMVLAFTGWPGLVIFAVAITVGLLPLWLGVRRVNLVGCLLLPILWWQWT